MYLSVRTALDDRKPPESTHQPSDTRISRTLDHRPSPFREIAQVVLEE